jgi:hypothetical protein
MTISVPNMSFLTGALLMLWSAIPWVAIFLITQLVGVRLYIVKDKEVGGRIQKRLRYSSHVADGGKKYGYAVGRWYLASVSVDVTDYGDHFNIWMVATAASFDALTAETIDTTAVTTTGSTTDTGTDKRLTIYSRVGTYSHVWFTKRTISLTNQTPRTEQSVIIDAVCEHHTKRGHTVVYLHGPPGSGKSMVGIMLAQRLGGSYCNTLKPWQPGDTLANLYAEVDPTAEVPLVLVFDEFDGALMAIHNGIPAHKAIPIAVADKAGWNKFFDEIDRGMFPHLLVVLTSNRDPAFVRALDPSYIRDGRVDLTFALSKS